MPRREFPRKLRAEIIARATNAKGEIVCEGCSLVLAGKKFEVDHTIPEAMVVDKTRKLTAKDGTLLGKACCHRAEGGKTAQDVAQIAKAKRQQDRGTGAMQPRGPKMQGPSFPGSKPRREVKALPPRALYRKDPTHGRP